MRAERLGVYEMVSRTYTLLIAIGLTGALLNLAGGTDEILQGLLLVGSTIVLLNFAYSYLTKRKFTVDLLMGIVGIITLTHQAYLEGILVLLLYGIAEIIEEIVESYAVRKIRGLVERLPKKILIIRGNTLVETPVDTVKPGDRVLLRKGEATPVDVVLLQEAQVDMSHVTGEPHPQRMPPGTEIPSGTIILTGPVKAVVTRPAKESFTQKLALEAMEAIEEKPRIARLLDKYTPHITFVVLFGYLALYSLTDPLRALSLLLVGCPSAFIITTGYSTALTGALLARHGVLVRNTSSMELIPKTRTLILDKTGTLTKVRAKPLRLPDNGAIELIMGAALASKHPVARAISASLESRGVYMEGLQEIAGKGLTGQIEILAGPVLECGKTAIVKTPMGEAVFCLLEELQDGARELVEIAKSMGARIVLASGDTRERVERVAKMLGIREYYYGLKPAEKARIVERYKEKGIVTYVGDGVNDVVAIAKAHVGVAVGGLEAASSVADIVVTSGARGVLETVRLSLVYRRMIAGSFLAIIVVKMVALVMGLFGAPLPVVAALGDDGSTLLGVLASSIFILNRR